MRPTCIHKAIVMGSIFLRNSSFFPYLKKQHKSRDKGYIQKQTFAAILLLYFLFSTFLWILLFGFPICIRIQSALITKNLRKANLQKTGVNITIVCIHLLKTCFLHWPSSSKKQTTSANNTSITPAISREPHLQRTIWVKTLKKQI